MDKATRRELLKTVESQADQLQRYEARLRDVVKAYKGLLKEKEALEASVKIFSDQRQKQDDGSSPRAEASKENTAEEKSQSSGAETFTDPLNANTDPQEESKKSEVMTLTDQLATLTNSLATVTQEKSKMEASYQAEKKRMRQEHEDAIKKFKEEEEKARTTIQQLQEQFQQTKSKIISQQHEREKEQTDHAVMLKELQKLLADERIEKEQLQLQLEEVQELLRNERQNVPDMSEKYEKTIHNLSNDMQVMRNRLKASEEKAAKPSPLLLDLQKEMAEMKAQHRIALQQEQKRTIQAEEQRKQVAQQSEERVSSLEAKLSELSEVVGTYERVRYQDQLAIQRLKERVTQLDMENTALARAAHSAVEHGDEDLDSNLDAQTLVERITKLKGLLKVVNERSEVSVNIEEILHKDEDKAMEEEFSNRRYKEEYENLKEEFERYKLRAQSVLKNKNTKETGGPKEVESLKNQLGEYKEKIRYMRSNFEEDEAEAKKTIEDLRKTIAGLHAKHQQDLMNAEAEHKQKEVNLELQIRKHRERTISLLAEKDKELEFLRAQSPERFDSSMYLPPYSRMRSDSSDHSDAGGAASSSEEAMAVSQLLAKTSLSPSTSGEGLLHFAQEQARRDVEITSLRKQKHSLETGLRELQLASNSKEERYQEKIEMLQEEIRKLERNKSRESANLEYLKNVVYQYMVCYEKQGRQQMLNAIATILQFSPKEKSKVQQHLYGWWYKPPKT